MASIEDVTLRAFRPGDGQGIVDLLNAVFAEDDPDYTPRTLAQWEWIYADNPAGRQVIVAEDPGGRIVGHYACIPYAVTVRGARHTCGQGVDSMVAKDYRRGLKSEGLFLRTARRYFADWGVPERNAYGYGFPNKKAFRIGVRMLDYVPIHAPVPTLARNLVDLPNDDEVAVGVDTAGTIEPITRFGAAMDRLWARLEAEERMGTVRDARFLNWRYLDCPFTAHQAFGLRDGDEWRGVVITRSGFTGQPIFACNEFLVPRDDVGAMSRLLVHVVEQARDAGQLRIELWFPPGHPHFGRVLGRGFRAEDSPFNLCIKIYDPALEPEFVRAHWLYSIGDTDVF